MNGVRVGILGCDGVAAINVVGPLEAFSNACQSDAAAARYYEVVVIGCDRDRFVTDTGVTFHATEVAPTDPPFDTIVVPGGRGMRDDDVVSLVADWIKSNAHRSRRLASVCTGVYGIAATGMLNGHRVTTHWQHAMDVASRFPDLQVEES